MKKPKYISIIFLLCLIFGGCKTAKVKYAGEKYFLDTTLQNQLSQKGLTLSVKNFLTTNVLNEKYKNSPGRVIKLCLDEINKPDSRIILEHNYRSTFRVIIELCLNQAKNLPEKEAITYWLTACYLSYRYLFDTEILPPLSKLKTPETGKVAIYYNFCLYKIFNYLQKNGLLNREGIKLEIIGGELKFTKPYNTMPWKLDSFKKFLLCYNYEPENFNETIFELGSGLPICCIPEKKDNFEEIESNIKIIKYLYPANFALKFKNIESKQNKFKVTPCYYDFYRHVFKEIDNQKIQLSNNYTTVIGKFLEKYPQTTEATFFFDPGEMIYQKINGLYLLSPFDKNKIPVLLIHGLISDPQSMAQILNTLMQSEIIREKYQFWFYFYPTGRPIIYTSFLLRSLLKKLYNKYKNDKTARANYNRMVVVGYSLGGLVAQLLTQGSRGDFLQQKVFFTELEKLRISRKHKDYLRKLFNFKPLSFVKQVIFISTPHRGAEMADWVSAQLMADLVFSPGEYYQEYKKTLMFVSQFTRSYNGRILTGNALNNLSPNSPFIRLTQQLPFSKRVKFHSIIGDENAANMVGGTDGVVPYSSSHLKDAVSEKIIKSDHHSIYKPACAKEVYRIIFQYLKSLQK